jgi:hypothetical protein
MLSTDETECGYNFRSDVMDRDVSCVISREHAVDCHAVHLIPRSKSDSVMFMTILCISSLIVFLVHSEGCARSISPLWPHYYNFWDQCH